MIPISAPILRRLTAVGAILLPGGLGASCAGPSASVPVRSAAVADLAAKPVPDHAEIRAAYRALDTTRNGAIGPKEWLNASVALFAATDENGDGFITSDEVGANALLREAIPSFDEAHSGRLSRAGFIKLRQMIFDAADISPNDYITFEEYELLVLMRRSGWTDRNRDGRIQMVELKAVLAAGMTLLDRNHDGVLSGDETAFFAPAHLAVMDPAHTGRITLDQLFKGYRFLLGADQTNGNLAPLP